MRWGEQYMAGTKRRRFLPEPHPSRALGWRSPLRFPPQLRFAPVAKGRAVRLAVTLGLVLASVALGSSDVAGAKTPSVKHPNTLWNTCEVNMANSVPWNIRIKSADKYSHDEWVTSSGSVTDPPGDLQRLVSSGILAQNLWKTESGFARGCWNREVFADGNGTVTVFVSDPYNGHNEYSCVTTGAFRCYGDNPRNQNLSGDHLFVIYKLCIDRLPCYGGTHIPPSKYP